MGIKRKNESENGGWEVNRTPDLRVMKTPKAFLTHSEMIEKIQKYPDSRSIMDAFQNSADRPFFEVCDATAMYRFWPV